MNVPAQNLNYYPPFNNRIIEAIQNKKAYVASDASVKNGQMAGYWTMQDLNQELLLHHHVYHKEQNENMVVRAEAITLLELIKIVERKGRGITHGRLVIRVDNCLVYHRIVENIAKPNVYAQDAGAEIAQIKKLIEKAKFDIQLELVKGHKKLKGNYSQRPLQYLIKECNLEVIRQRERLSELNEIHNIKYEGFCAVKHKGVICSKSIKEAIRNIDAMETEL